MERRYVESFFFLALLLGTMAVVVMMVFPFANILILAAILAFLFSTVYERLAGRLGGQRSLAALLVTLLVFVTVLVPLALAGWRIATEATALYTSLRSHADPEELLSIVSRLEAVVQQFAPGFQLDPAEVSMQIQNALRWLVGQLGSLFAGVTRLIASFLLLLLFFYYLLRDGDRLKRRVMELSPLSSDQEELIFSKLGRSVTSVVRGSVIMAVLQGLMSGLGMTLFGLPNPALWGAAAMLAAFIPTLGTALVNIPAIIYLFATGHPNAAVGLTIWAATAVGLLDNVVGPKLVAAGTRIHPLIILVSVLGGVSMFGAMGILLGPIMVSLLFALFDVYLSLIRGPYLREHLEKSADFRKPVR